MSANPNVRKPYRPVRDHIKIIRPNAFKEQLTDTSDIVLAKKKLAPRTKKAMYNLTFEHLENYFLLPGRRIYSRPIQKLFDRQVDAKRKEAKNFEHEEDLKVGLHELEPLDDDLRTSSTRDLLFMIDHVGLPKTITFPKRNPGDVRKSYVKKTPKRKPPQAIPSSSFSTAHSSLIMQPEIAAARSSRTRSQSHSQSENEHVVLECYTKEEPEESLSNNGDPLMMEVNIDESQIPQYATEISLNNAGVTITESNSVNPNVLDMSDLIQTSDTQIDGKIEIASTDIVLCGSIEEMNEVVVMGQDGSRYRFVALADGQLSLVPESAVQ